MFGILPSSASSRITSLPPADRDVDGGAKPCALVLSGARYRTLQPCAGRADGRAANTTPVMCEPSTPRTPTRSRSEGQAPRAQPRSRSAKTRGAPHRRLLFGGRRGAGASAAARRARVLANEEEARRRTVRRHDAKPLEPSTLRRQLAQPGSRSERSRDAPRTRSAAVVLGGRKRGGVRSAMTTTKSVVSAGWLGRERTASIRRRAFTPEAEQRSMIPSECDVGVLGLLAGERQFYGIDVA